MCTFSMDNLINKNSFYISGLLGSKVKYFKKRVNRIVVNFSIVQTLTGWDFSFFRISMTILKKI